MQRPALLSGARALSRPRIGGAKAQDRTADTGIFSAVLYQLSYLGRLTNRTTATRAAKVAARTLPSAAAATGNQYPGGR